MSNFKHSTPEYLRQKRIINLVTALRSEFEIARKIVGELDYELLSLREEDQDEGAIESAKAQLSYLNRGIFLKLCLAFTFADAATIAQDLRETFSKREYTHDLQYDAYAGCLFCPTTSLLSQYLDALEASELPKEYQSDLFEAELKRLENCLQGTSKMLSDAGVTPGSEAVVRERVYSHLIHPFPDTVREVPIPKVAKTYKPDLGIVSLKAAIEYKFAVSLEELKAQIGGIYEDVHGYAGSEDWTIFYAVFYVTGDFMTQPQLIKEFANAKIPNNWRPMLIKGPGARKKAPRKSKHISPSTNTPQPSDDETSNENGNLNEPPPPEI